MIFQSMNAIFVSISGDQDHIDSRILEMSHLNALHVVAIGTQKRNKGFS